MKTHYALRRAEYEREVDTTLAGSFPASDSPFWTFGVSPADELDRPNSVYGVSRPAAIDVIIRDEGRRLGGIRLANIGEAIAMMAVLPFAILIAGAPLIAVVWGLSHAVAWLTGSN
jgi:hypothetical protein